MKRSENQKYFPSLQSVILWTSLHTILIEMVFHTLVILLLVLKEFDDFSPVAQQNKLYTGNIIVSGKPFIKVP